MKCLLLMIVVATLLSACEKNNQSDSKKACPVISETQLPASVILAFQQKYPDQTAIKWFNRGNKGYAALISINGNEELIQFDNDGNLVGETNVDQQGEDQDNQGDNQDDQGDNSNECECETGD